jgi:hypothetical protein
MLWYLTGRYIAVSSIFAGIVVERSKKQEAYLDRILSFPTRYSVVSKYRKVSFGSWSMRCLRPGPGSCFVVQRKGSGTASIATFPSLSLSPPHVMSLTKANKYRGRILQEQIK